MQNTQAKAHIGDRDAFIVIMGKLVGQWTAWFGLQRIKTIGCNAKGS